MLDTEIRGLILIGQDRCVGCREERLNVARIGLRCVGNRDERFNLDRAGQMCWV